MLTRVTASLGSRFSAGAAVLLAVFILSACVTAVYEPDLPTIAENQARKEGSGEQFTQWAQTVRSDRPQIGFQLGHSDVVYSVAFSADGRYALTGSKDETAKLWEIESGREVRTLAGHSGQVFSVAFSADGRYVLTGSGDGTAKLWDVGSGGELRTFGGHSDRVRSVAFSPDDRYVLTGDDDGSVILWEVESGREVQTFVGHSDWVSQVAFSPDGRYALTGSGDGTAKLWDVSSVHEVRVFRGRAQVRSVAFSPDGRYLLLGYDDGTAKLWDVESGGRVRTFRGHSDKVSSVAVSPDGRYALTGSEDATAKLWEISSGREMRTFTVDSDWVAEVAFSPDGRYALTSSGNAAKLWEVESGHEVRTLEGLSNYVYSVEFSPDGRYVLTGSRDSTAKLWEVETGREVRTFAGHSGSVRSVAFSSDARYALTGSRDETAKLWEVESGREVQTFEGHTSLVSSVAFSPNGRYVLTGSWDDTAKLWDAETGREVRTFAGHTEWIRSVAFSPDGRYVLTGSDDYTAKLWDVETGRELRTLRGHSSVVFSVAFSPDGRYALTGGIGNESAKLWEVESGREVRTFAGHTEWIGSVAFSPDGRYALTGSRDETSKLWEVESGREVRTFAGHSAELYSVAFSPDGRHALTGSKDGTIGFWDTESGDRIYTAFSTPDGRSLTWTPEGYFSGDPDLGREAVYFVDGLTTIGIDQFFDQYYRPDIVEAGIAGRDITELVGTRTAAESIVPLPRVSMELERGGGTFRGLTPETTAGVTDVSSTDYLVADGRVRVRVTAEDTGGGAEDIRLFHNGTRVAGRSRGLARDDGAASGGADGAGASTSQTFTVTLADGGNELRATAFSETRVESDPAVVVIDYEAPRQERPTLWVLAVGIDEYQNESYNLNYAVADAQGFSRQIQGSAGNLFEDVEARVLTDGQATRERIEASLDAIAQSARPQDVFAFFYAGHGIPVETDTQGGTEFYFLLHDVTEQRDESQLASRGIAGADFSQLVASIPARNQLHVIDACYAGAITTAFLTQASATRVSLDRMSRANGSALIAAARAEQEALEFPALGQGALTYALIEGLEGEAAAFGGDEITARMLSTYAGVTVPRLTAQHSGRAQDPTGFINGVDFPVGMR